MVCIFDRGRAAGDATLGRARVISRGLLTVVICGALTGTALAQTSQNLPFGSPLSPLGDLQQQSGNQGNQQQQQQQDALLNPAPSSNNRLQPTQVNSVNDPTPNDQSAGNNATDQTSDQTTLTGSRTASNLQMTNQTVPDPRLLKRPAPPNEFEQFVEQRLGRRLPRFGANLLTPSARDYSIPATAAIPPDYKLGPGDEVFIGLSGSIEGSVRRRIDNRGQIFLEKVGAVQLGGVSFRDLEATVTRAVGVRYRGFDVAVAVTRLRGIRVYVTGFANNPGAFTVDSLSTLVNAVLAAGGPSSGGSFRSIRLFRNGQLLTDFDLYDFLRRGDRGKDVVLQNQDVIDIAPLGSQIALTGSVNEEAIYEGRPGERVSDLLLFGGGVNVLADPDRVIVYHIANASTVGGVEVSRASFTAESLAAGDIVQILSAGSLANPLERQTVVVRIEGEVAKPGNYVVAPNTGIEQIVALAGGLTPRAFAYGTRFQRVSVRQQQRESFQEAVQQLEVQLASAPLTTSSTLSDASQAAQLAAARATLDRLRQAQPDGRVVLPLTPSSTVLPASLVLENNDAIFVPPRATTVGVFGAVYRPASFLIEDGQPRRIKSYLEKAGGTLRAADTRDVFVVHANGSVVSRRRGALSERVIPGDVIFVPVKSQNVSFLAKLAQISSILFQTGLSAAAFLTVTR